MSLVVSHLGVCKYTSEFNASEQELKQLLHDVKSPISSLNMCLGYLEKQNSDPKISEALTIFKLSLERLNSLVHKNQVNTFNTLQVVESVASEIKFVNSIRFLPIIVNDGIARSECIGNGDTFRNILFNIINNSINAMANEVSLTVVELENGLVIKIKDNGAGIEKKLINYIGKTGYSFQKSSSISGGQGLGLSHAADTIKSWGGSLTVSSEVSKGTEISIFLVKK